MKKLLFVIPEYSHGGTNKSLENLLHFIDHTRYDVSIYCLYEDGGEYYKNVFRPYIVDKSFLYTLLHDNWMTRKFMGLFMRLSANVNFNWLYRKEANRIQEKYGFDTIIAYQEGVATEFVSYVDECDNKIAWIHFDYSMLCDKMDLRSRMIFYNKYNRLICVSQAALDSMLAVQPEYRDKSSYIYNFLCSDAVLRLASDNSASPHYENDVFNILSIGRFVEIKQFHIIPMIAKGVRERINKRFCWFIMGDGEMYDVICRNIIANNVQDCVKIIKANDNPYPFFRNADLYVCISTHESFSYTIAESKILKTPVLCNDFPVAKEVVDDSVGWICDIKGMINMLADIIEDKDGCYTKKKESISNYNYDNTGSLARLYQIL